MFAITIKTKTNATNPIIIKSIMPNPAHESLGNELNLFFAGF